MALSSLTRMPGREIALSSLLLFALAADWIVPDLRWVLFAVGLVGSLPTLWLALQSARERRITIDTFNAFALVISLVTGEWRSTAFIGLMLSAARVLDWQTESKTRRAVEELLKLKPETSQRVTADGKVEEVAVGDIQKHDQLIVPTGTRFAVDGRVADGEAYVNEAAVTGESVPIRKAQGDLVLAGTLVETGAVTILAIQVGADTTIERMASLMREAGTHKSRSEKLADRFAGIFLPIVALIGAVTYLATRSADMTAAIFLVACADDMAVAIPLAMTAAIGRAAKRGVIIKGGEWLDVLSRINTVVLDKTGTLTYGSLHLRDVWITPDVQEHDFWKMLGSVEKYSEHPVGRAAFHAARQKTADIPEPEGFRSYRGAGASAEVGGRTVTAGGEEAFEKEGCVLTAEDVTRLQDARHKHGQTAFAVCIDKKLAGIVSVADEPRPEARQSLDRLKALGITRIVMFTGDHEDVAKRIGASLGFHDIRASMKPEDKLKALEALGGGPIAMVGDGINDAPALARADVGIAMGGGGAAVAVEAADVVILTDNLSRLPEVIELGRLTRKVIHGDMAIWFVTNLFGFALVLFGFAGPSLAAFYNFATDFLPLLNSTRLFRGRSAPLV